MTRFPLRLKLLGLMVVLLAASFASLLYLAIHLFNEDKRAYIYGANASYVAGLVDQMNAQWQSTTQFIEFADVFLHETAAEKLAFKSRMEPLLHSSDSIVELRIAEEDSLLIQQINGKLLEPHKVTSAFFDQLAEERPIIWGLAEKQGIHFQNRTLRDSLPLLAITMKGPQSGKLITATLLLGSEYKALWDSGVYESFLLDQRGEILVHPDRKLLTKPNSLQDHPAIKRVLNQASYNGAFEWRDAAGKVYMLSYAKAFGGRIMAISQVDAAKAFYATEVFLKKALLLGLILFALCVLATIFFSASITRPLQRLVEATQSVARGRFDIRVDVKSNDEVKDLAQSFNSMSEEIARLIEAEREKAALDKELEAAEMVQRTLYTKDGEAGRGIRLSGRTLAAGKCGGDWWGHFQAQDGREFVWMGDATGHGIPAALVTAIAYGCLRTLERELQDARRLSPAYILEAFNKVLWGATRGEMNMTMFCCSVDSAAGQLEFANAGHAPAYYLPFRPKTGDKGYKALNIRGEIIGSHPESVYEAHSIPLEAGDKVFLYTDGLYEGGNSNGQPWGQLKMRQTMARLSHQTSTAFQTGMMQAAFSHFGDKELGDDVSVLVLEYTGMAKAS